MAGTLGSANVTNLGDRCEALGVTHREIAERAGCSRQLVTFALRGHRTLQPYVRDAAEALLRERLAEQVETLGAVMAATLEEAGGVDAELDAMRDAVADLTRTAKRLEVAQ